MHQPSTYWKRNFHFFFLVGIIGFYLINGIAYLRQQSITSDESSFMDYAIRYVKGNPDRIYPVTDNSKMPVNSLNLIPRIAQKVFSRVEGKNDWGVSDNMNGRYVTLLLSIITILLVFKWVWTWFRPPRWDFFGCRNLVAQGIDTFEF